MKVIGWLLMREANTTEKGVQLLLKTGLKLFGFNVVFSFSEETLQSIVSLHVFYLL